MKKVLKLITVFAVACMLVIGLATTAYAEPSKSDAIEITSEDGFEYTDTFEIYDGMDIPRLTAAYAATVISGAKESELEVVWQGEIYADAPITMTFTPTGASDKEVYVFHYDVGKIDAMEGWGSPLSGSGSKGSATVTFDSLSPVGVVVRTTSGSPSDETSPKTGEMNVLFYAACAAIVVGSIATGVVIRKKSVN